MCNVGDDTEDTFETKYMPSIKEKFSLASLCNKCKEQKPCVVLRAKDKYCRECFLAGAVHKFKATLGKHKFIRPKDNVLVIYKCGHPSSALLHMIKSGLGLQEHKRLCFQPIVVFIEGQFHMTVEERKNLMSKVQKEVQNFDFSIYFMSLTQLVKAPISDNSLNLKPETLDIYDEDQNDLEQFLGKQGSSTHKEDLLNILIRQLWINVAKILNCKLIFVPDISIDVASKLMSDISLGRGTEISLDTGFCDDRDDIKILRPLRLYDAKELAIYNHFCHIEPVLFREPMGSIPKSIQSLTKKFVIDLQMNYPATVSTISKTGERLASAKNLLGRCSMCLAPLDSISPDLSSAESTLFSCWASMQIPDSKEQCNKSFTANNVSNVNNVCFACAKLKT